MFRLKMIAGIDIGSKMIRVALIQKRNNSLHLLALISESIDGVPLEEALRDIKIKLKHAYKIPHFWFTDLVMGIPQSQVAVKRFSAMPDMHEEEQYIQVGMQLAESLGLPIDELLYDYRSLVDTDAVEVYACRRAVIDETLNALKTNGYRLSVIELQTHALMRLYQQHRVNLSSIESSLMVDVGNERVLICAGDGMSGQFFRELPLPFGDNVSSEVEAKRVFTEKLIDIIQRQYQFVATALTGGYINRVWLSGENAKYVDFFLLEEKLQWDVQILNPLQGLIFHPDLINDLSDSANAWSIAVGLALRGV